MVATSGGASNLGGTTSNGGRTGGGTAAAGGTGRGGAFALGGTVAAGSTTATTTSSSTGIPNPVKLERGGNFGACVAQGQFRDAIIRPDDAGALMLTGSIHHSPESSSSQADPFGPIALTSDQIVHFQALVAANAASNGLAKKPPMGWNSWNKFGCGPDMTESKIRAVADAMVNSGMQKAGYQYIILDDCWQQVNRDSKGNVVPDPNFTTNMSALVNYVHNKGLKFGLYSDRGTNTCQGRAGSYGHETQDAKT